jgi:hypothetical protein
MTKEEVIISLGLDNAEMKTGLAGSDFVIQNSVGNTLKSLKKLVAINLVSMAFQAVDIWNDATKKIADIWYGATAEGNRAGALDARTKVYANLNKERWADEEKARKAEDEAAKDRIKRDNLLGKAAEVDRERELSKIKDIEQRETKRLTMQEQELKELRKVISYRDDIVTSAQKQLAVAEKEKDVQESRNRLQDIANARLRSYNDLMSAQLGAANQADRRLFDAKRGRLEFSLGELSQDNTGWGNQARQITQLQDWAKWNVRHGNFDKAKGQMGQADKMFDDLKTQNPFLKDPMGDLKHEAVLQNEKLEKIISDGLQIKAAD